MKSPLHLVRIQKIRQRYGSIRCERQGVGRVEMIDRPTALADVGAGSYTSLDIPIRLRYSTVDGQSGCKIAGDSSCGC